MVRRARPKGRARGMKSPARAAQARSSANRLLRSGRPAVVAVSLPCRHVKKYPEHKRERFLSDDEYRRLGAALRDAEREGFASPAAIAAIRLLMLTGCRSGEILSLRWGYVDLDTGELRLPDSKTGAKVVHLGDPAIAVLRGIPRTEGNPWVLPGFKRGRHIAYLHDSWRRILDRADIENLRIHDLRHSCASMTYNSLAIRNLFISSLIPKSYSHRIHSIPDATCHDRRRQGSLSSNRTQIFGGTLNLPRTQVGGQVTASHLDVVHDRPSVPALECVQDVFVPGCRHGEAPILDGLRIAPRKLRPALLRPADSLILQRPRSASGNGRSGPIRPLC